jgi:hypothetical protein
MAAVQKVFERYSSECRVQTARQDVPAEPVALDFDTQPAARAT